MPVMDIGEMRVAVRQQLVRMLVSVRLSVRIGFPMCMAMVLVMHVPVTVRHGPMAVQVLGTLGGVQP